MKGINWRCAEFYRSTASIDFCVVKSLDYGADESLMLSLSTKWVSSESLL